MVTPNSHSTYRAYGFDARGGPEALGLGAQIYAPTIDLHS